MRDPLYSFNSLPRRGSDLNGDRDVLENVLNDCPGLFMCFVAGRTRPSRKDSMGEAGHGELPHIARHQIIPAVQKSKGPGRAQQADGAAGAHAHLKSGLDPGSLYDGHDVRDQGIVYLDLRHFLLQPKNLRRLEDRLDALLPRILCRRFHENLALGAFTRVSDRQPHEEAIDLTFGKRIRAVMF